MNKKKNKKTMDINKQGFAISKVLIIIGAIIVIAIVAFLMTQDVEVNNQMSAEQRDSQRMRDLSMLRDSLSMSIIMALSEGNVAALNAMCPGVPTHTAPTAISNTNANIPLMGVPSSTWQPFVSQASITSINGDGWIPLDFATLSLGGTPFTSLPIDPLNNGGPIDSAHFYAFTCINDGFNITFELNTILESPRHLATMANDGGNQSNFYEIGTNLSL